MKAKKSPAIRRSLIALTSVSLGALAFSNAADAQTTWSLTSSSGNWSTASNWSNGAPVSGSTTTVSFGGLTSGTTYTSNNDLGVFSLNSLVFSGSWGTTVSGGTLAFLANGSTQPTIVFNDAAVVNVTSGISVGSGATLTVGGSSASLLTLGGNISGAGAIVINKLGSGPIVISGNNSFSGGLTVTNGDIAISAATGATVAAFGSGTITMNGGDLRTTGASGSNIVIANALQLGTTTKLGASNTTAHNMVFTGAITLAGTGTTSLTIAASASGTVATLAGAIGESTAGTGLALTGSAGNVLVMSGSQSNTYTGTTTVSNILLQLGKTNGAVAINGPLSILTGTVQLLGSNQLASSSVLYLSAGTFDLNGNSQAVTGGTALTSSGNITNTAAGTTSTLTFNLNNAGSIYSQYNSTIADGAGALALSVVGSNTNTGTLILNGNNAFSGGLSITNATVSAATNTALGTGTITLNNNAVLGSNGTVYPVISNALVISGTSVNLGRGGASYITYNGAVTLSSGSHVLNLSSTGTAAVLNGVISDGGSGLPLNITGQGVLVMGGNQANTYTGVTQIASSNATLLLGKASAIASGTLQITTAGGTIILGADNGISAATNVVLNSGTLDLNGHNDTVYSLSSGAYYGSVLTNNAASTSSTLTLNSTVLTGVNNNQYAYYGSIKDGAGKVAIVYTGTNELVLYGTGSTFSGGFTTNNLVAITANNSLGTGTITLNSGARLGTTYAASATLSNALVINGTVTLNRNSPTYITETGVTTLGSGTNAITLAASVASGTAFVFGGAIQDGAAASSVVYNGTGVIAYTGGTSNTYTGVTTVNSANTTLQLAKTGGATAIAGALNLVSGTVAMLGSNQFSSTSALSLNGGVFDLNGYSQTVGALSGSASGLITSNATGAVNLAAGDSTTSTFAGTIQDGSGTVSLTKKGTGTLILTGNNTYTGVTTISDGTLQLGNGADTGNIGLGDIVDNGTLAFNYNTYNNVVYNYISGAGSVSQNGVGKVQLSGSNDYTGGTVINAGSLQLLDAHAMGATTGKLTINGGELDLDPYSSGYNVTIGSLAGTGGSITSSGLAATSLTVNNTDSSSYSGVITGNTVALVKQGTGKLTLGGVNTYQGETTIAGGTLALAAAGSISNSAKISVQSGATFDVSAHTSAYSITSGQTLTNAGTVTGDLSISGIFESSGIVNGALTIKSAGELVSQGTTISGSLTVESGALVSITLDSLSSNAIVANSSVTLSGATLSLDLGSLSLTSGEEFTLINASTAISGSFSKVIIGSSTTTLSSNTFTMGSTTYELSYSGGLDSNDVTLTVLAVPEPGTWAMLTGGLGMLLGYQRMRRRQ